MATRTARLLPLLLLLLAGCSSLPPGSERQTALESRAETTYQAGLQHYRLGRYAQAAVCFEQALGMHASVDHRPGTARALASLGRARLAQGDPDAAAAAFQRSLDAVRDLRRPDLAAQALGGLAAVALERGETADARAWLEAGLALPLPDPGAERAVLLHDLGMAAQQDGDVDAAEELLRRALAMHESLGDPLGAAADGHSLAVLRAAAGDLAEAELLAKQALARDKAQENPRGVAQDLMLLGAIAAQGGRTADAVDFYRRAELAWAALDRPDAAAAAAERVAALSSSD